MPPPLQLDVKLRRLEEGPLHPFADWPNGGAVPDVAAGTYSIWRADELIYVGMSGRHLSADDLQSARGEGHTRALYKRLKAHTSGRWSGNPFCTYVCDRLIVPALTPDQQEKIRRGELSLDELTRNYIREHLGYRFVATWNGERARRIEREARRGALGAGKPLLNPL